MLHLEYVESDYMGTHIDIQPGNDMEIPGLRDIVRRNLIIENPAKTFARKMRRGESASVDEDEIAAEAEVANVLAELWTKEPEMNAIMLLSRALQMVANLTLEKKDLEPDEQDDSEWEDTE